MWYCSWGSTSAYDWSCSVEPDIILQYCSSPVQQRCWDVQTFNPQLLPPAQTKTSPHISSHSHSNLLPSQHSSSQSAWLTRTSLTCRWIRSDASRMRRRLFGFTVCNLHIYILLNVYLGIENASYGWTRAAWCWSIIYNGSGATLALQCLRMLIIKGRS